MYNIISKKILIIGTGFYDYDACLIKAFEGSGAIVSYYNSNILDLKIRLYRRLNLRGMEKQYILSRTMSDFESFPKNVDLIFIIKGENLNKVHLRLLKKCNPKAKIVLYFWDSINRMPNVLELLEEIEIVYTFDRCDSIKYNLNFLPLFYRPLDIEDNCETKYDISFVGSMHSTRYAVLKELKKKFQKEGVSFKFYLYTGAFELWYRTNITKEIDKADMDLFTTKPMSYRDYVKLSALSNVILDISNPLQSGLTIRSIETIGLNKKLLTTNRDIVNYGFNSNDYMVLDESLDVNCSFIQDKCSCNWSSFDFSLRAFISTITKSIEFD